MSLMPTAGQDVFSEVSSRLTTLASRLSDTKAPSPIEPSFVAQELDSIALLAGDGISEMYESSQRAANLAPTVEKALFGMTTLADRIERTPSVATAPATIDAITGWAELSSGAMLAMHRL